MAAEPEGEEATEVDQLPPDHETHEAAELPRVPCHIFLPVVPAARVIGKGGASIKAIREQSGASLRVLQKELPQEMQRREDRVAVITGEAQQVQEAIAGVLERVFDRSGLPEQAEGSLRERDYIVEVLVPEKSGSHLIGQKGERVKLLCQETKCDIRVGQDRVSGLGEQKKVRISGSCAADAAGAIWRVMEVLGELVAGGVLKSDHFDLRGGSMASFQRRDQKEVAIRLLIAKEDAAWILGKRGNKIARLRDWAKVNMIDAESPPFDASERVLEISTAMLESRVKVVQMVLEDLESRQEASEKLRLLVPTDQFGSVMGHRGETLRGIIQSSRATVQQHKAEALEGKEYRFRLMEIKGDISQRVDVVRQVHSALENRGNRDAAAPGGAFRPAMAMGGMAGMAGMSGMAGLGMNLAGALSGARSAPGLSVGDLGTLTLQLAMPNEEMAHLLSSNSSGIARRAGVKLSSARGAGGLPVLKVSGTAVANSVACYLIQDRLFMMN